MQNLFIRLLDRLEFSLGVCVRRGGMGHQKGFWDADNIQFLDLGWVWTLVIH